MNSFMEHYRNEFLLEKIITNKNFEKLSSQDQQIIEQGRKYEEDFFAKKYPSDTDMQNLGDHYKRAYEIVRKESLVPDDFQEKLLERALITKEKMIGFDMLTNFITDYLRRMRMKLEQGNGLAPKEYIYIARSNYAFFYLNFSHSMWRLSEGPEYFMMGKRTEEFSGTYNYAEAISKFGEEKLLEWIDLANQLKANR